MSGELQQTGALLPAWVGWCPIAVYLALAALLSLIACGTAAWLAGRPLRRLASGHWTERARLAWPIRVTTSVAALAVPALIAVGVVLTVGPLARWSPLAIACACCAVSVASAMVVRFWSERQLRPSAVTGPIWLTGAAALTLIRLPHLVLFLVTTVAMLTLPPLWTTSTVLVAVLSGLGFLGCALGGGTWLARRIGLIRPAGPRLAGIVRDHAERMGAPVAGVFEVRMAMANAFALPVRKWILVTEPALEDLDDPELSAVVAHELGHLREPPAAFLGRVSPMLAFFLIAIGRPIVGTFGVTSAVVLAALIVGTMMLARRVGRRLEERADGVAKEHEAESGVYARALEKLYRSNLMPAVLPSRRPLHPHLYDRMITAGVVPAYPRPAPPPRLAGLRAVAVGSFVLASLGAAYSLGIAGYVPDAQGQESTVLATAALSGGTAEQISWLALRRYRGGDSEAAIALYAMAADAPGADHGPATSLAILLAASDECDAAEDWILEAQSRFGARSTGDPPTATEAWKAVSICRQRRGEQLDEDVIPDEP